MSDEILRFEGVSKFFPGVIANNKVNLSIRRGEIHCLLGENGAGKSTLMNILYGLYKADEGQIYYNGKPVEIKSPDDAIKSGIGMIHQHFMLIPNFTVWENVILGQRFDKRITVPVELLKQRVLELAKKLRLNIDVNQRVDELSVGLQQKVEILKAIYRGAKLLILDEPTSVLTPQESEELFGILNELRSEGTTAIFISHKLKEVMEICDRVSVLRDGVLIETRDIADCTPEILSALMVGRNVESALVRTESKPGEVRLELKQVSMKGKTHASSLKNISLNVHAGEIVGIAGVDGNGQDELSNVIVGLDLPESGTITLCGEDVTHMNIRDRGEKKLSYVPSDRRGEALVMDFMLFENASMTSYDKPPISKGKILNLKAMRALTRSFIKDYNIKAPNTDVLARNLSGGNQQKLILAREMHKDPDVLLMVQPTWGLDIGACEFIYHKMLEAKARGTAIILISTDLEEVRSLSDRLLVLYEGEIVGEVDPAVAEVEEIGVMMAGGRLGGQT